MISQKHLHLTFVTYAIIVFRIITGYPTEDPNMEYKMNGAIQYPSDNDAIGVPMQELNLENNTNNGEIRYPNGTVVGDFSYIDEDGSSINVKYFADQNNYGVELKSSKTGPDKNLFWKASSYHSVENPDEAREMSDKIQKSQDDNNRKVERTEEMDTTNLMRSADYETFYRKDVKDLNQCENDKVRVYLNKEMKIIKRELENYKAARSCGRY